MTRPYLLDGEEGMPDFGVCHSCGTERHILFLRHPLSFAWEVREDLWECRDGEMCYAAMRGARS